MVPLTACVEMLIMQIVDDYFSQALRVLAIAMYQMQALPLTEWRQRKHKREVSCAPFGSATPWSGHIE